MNSIKRHQVGILLKVFHNFWK